MSWRRTTRFLGVPIVLWLVILLIVRVTVAAPESQFSPSASILRQTAAEAGDWLVANQKPDGRYVYEYDRRVGEEIPGYNIVRHAGVTMSLYQLAGQLGEPEYLAAADRATDWLMTTIIRHDDWAAPSNGSTAKVGSAALMTVALAERRLLTGETTYDQVMQELGRFMVRMQRDDGGFYTKWFVDEQQVDRVSTSAYYPGEALWALALLHEAFPDQGWDRAAWRAADFVTLLRDELEDVPFPPLNDHWASYGLAEMVEWDGGLKGYHVDYARRMAGRFSLFIRFEAQKTDGPISDRIRWGERRSAALGTWVEGLAALWRLASTDERLADVRDEIRARALLGAGLLVERQADADDNPAVDGAWFVDGVTRMDDQQHATSGLLYTANALDGIVRREPLEVELAR